MKTRNGRMLWVVWILGCALIASVAIAGQPYKDPADTSMTVIVAGTTEGEDPDPEPVNGDTEPDTDPVEFEVNPQITCPLAPVIGDPDPDVNHEQEMVDFLDCVEEGLSEEGYKAEMWRDDQGNRDPDVAPSVSVQNVNGTPIEDLRVIEHDDDIEIVTIRVDRGDNDRRSFRAEIGGFLENPTGTGGVFLVINGREDNEVVVNTYSGMNRKQLNIALYQAIVSAGYVASASGHPISRIYVDWDTLEDSDIESIQLRTTDKGLITSDLWLKTEKAL